LNFRETSAPMVGKTSSQTSPAASQARMRAGSMKASLRTAGSAPAAGVAMLSGGSRDV
jgi:hypothetical protein